jgi:hypothetical protein
MAQLEKTIKARVSDEEKLAVELAAKMAHTTESEFIRKFVGFGAREVLSQEMGKTIEGVSGLNKQFHMLTGIKPAQLMKILFFIGEIAAEGGRASEFESILNLIFKDPSFGTGIIEITQKYSVLNEVAEKHVDNIFKGKYAKEEPAKEV